MRTVFTQRGTGLIEVMVTVLLLSTSLLGLAALQNRSLQYNHSAYLRSQANILAYDLLDRIRINRANMDNYELETSDDKPTGTALYQKDLREWRQSISSALPDGVGGITCDTGQVCTVTIQWSEQDGTGVEGDSGTVDTGKSSFQYTTRI